MIVQIPNPIYTKLALSDADDFIVKINKCWATPTVDPTGKKVISHFNDNWFLDAMSYNFIDKYQVVSTETADVAISNNCDGKTASFSVNSFSFGEKKEVYFHCELDICNAKNEDCSCAAIARKRREAHQENDVKLSIGPLSVAI